MIGFNKINGLSEEAQFPQVNDIASQLTILVTKSALICQSTTKTDHHQSI